MFRTPSIDGVDPTFPIRLIALDIDGTLIGDDHLIPPRTQTAIRAARDRGVAVALITGRTVAGAMRFARELDLSLPIIGYQGGLIRAMPPPGSARLGRLLVHSPVPAEAARDILRWTKTVGLSPHINHLERFLVQSDDPRIDEYVRFMGQRATIVDDLVEWVSGPVTKVIAAGDPPLASDMAGLGQDRFAGVAEVTMSHPRFLEFVAPGVSKGRAVRWLARRTGVALAETLAIGDQWNDAEMLAEVGHGAAMPSAPDGVRAVARYLAPPLEDEGAAVLIESLVLVEPDTARANAERFLAHERP